MTRESLPPLPSTMIAWSGSDLESVRAYARLAIDAYSRRLAERAPDMATEWMDLIWRVCREDRHAFGQALVNETATPLLARIDVMETDQKRIRERWLSLPGLDQLSLYAAMEMMMATSLRALDAKEELIKQLQRRLDKAAKIDRDATTL